jgi:hypothetical protein
MISIQSALTFLFTLKFALDFLSPFRDLNFVIFNTFVLLLFISQKYILQSIHRKTRITYWARIFSSALSGSRAAEMSSTSSSSQAWHIIFFVVRASAMHI